jgi:nitroreductase
MELKELMQKRYSVRRFKEQEVEKEKILKVLDMARFAPSAVNLQPWHFLVIQDPEKLKEIKTTYEISWFQKAPAVIVALGDHSKSWKRKDGKDHCDIDLGIVVDHLTLAATDQGLGTCWVCAFDAEKCIEILDLPNHLEPIALIPIGYPLYETAKNKTRNDLDTMVSWDKLQ